MLELLGLFLVLARPPALPMTAIPAIWKPSFRFAERAVDNWRLQAALDLDLGAQTASGWLLGNTPANLPRCIRLNNYWCIKTAGWAGEIGVDAEGHAAFASAEEGAVAAVVLLRRYYRDYGRRSARAIVAHWAPAQCDLPVAGSGAPPPPQPPTSLAPLAKYGIGNTLRARWLAAHGRGGRLGTRSGARKVAVRRSVVPDRPARIMPSPRLAIGMGAPEPPLVLEPPLKTEKLRVASASPPTSRSEPPLVPPPRPPLQQPVTSCAGDTLRLANYAAQAANGIAHAPDEDLKLFEADGRPRASLQRLLANMAAMEIGPYRPDAKLIEAAIAAAGNAPSRSASAGR
jgi:hypothetical protein